MESRNLLPDGFAQGTIRYLDNLPGWIEQVNRIYLLVRFGDNEPSYAVLDTGAPYCILDPGEGAALGLDYRACGRGGTRIQGVEIYGWMCRIPVRIIAERGESIEVDASVLIPELEPHQQWLLPNFLGMSFLERIRFAVDPEHSLFYFGAFGGD